MTIYDQIRNQLWPKGSRPDVWMIADCARDKRIYPALIYSGLVHECLFAGHLSVALQRTAPYLVQLEMDDKATIRLINEGFGDSWGIFLRADVGIKTLRKHLRTILRVQGPDNRYLLFRYWDPRVMRVYLPTCLADELRKVFGPIDYIFCEDHPSQSRMLRFADISSKLNKVEIRLRSEDPIVSMPTASSSASSTGAP